MKQWHWDAGHPGIVEHPEGAWVLVTDAAAAIAETRKSALVAAALKVQATVDLSSEALRLQYGEMTAGEIRLLRAVLEQQANAILRMANIDLGDDEGDYDVG